MEIGRLANGNEVIYFAATSERTVYSVEEMGGDKAMVRVFASDAGTPKNLGYPATTGVMNSPDNLAQDALGNIYIIEDSPNRGNIGGDIWFARDVDNDGVAESVDHFMSLVADGAEATGMIFNPKKPTEFIVAVQHPDSTDLNVYPEGQGDAMWVFDLKNVVPPVCNKKSRKSDDDDGYRGKRSNIRSCVKAKGFNFVKALKKTAK
jgi:secreted PhoX family phosphatase